MSSSEHLVPVSEYLFGFTTSSLVREKIQRVSLDDRTLGVHKVSSKTTHRIVIPPQPKSPDHGLPHPTEAWEAFYPKGSINPSAPIPGGFGFYLSGPNSFADGLASGAKEVVFSYRMMFEDGWEWVKGGKLPGVFGGVGDLSYRCTGGRQEQRCRCFDLRPMWRSQSAAELYTYIPLTPGNSSRLLKVPPVSKANADYGFSVGRGSFHLDTAAGRWVSIALRIKLNDPGSENGELQVWFDGISRICSTGLVLCESEEGRIKGMHFQTFFGGHTDDWASPRDQRAWFADISGVIVK